ncbi:MAG: CsgG/HfaB family protein [Candidatus Margulisiibacteriota bacterium]
MKKIYVSVIVLVLSALFLGAIAQAATKEKVNEKADAISIAAPEAAAPEAGKTRKMRLAVVDFLSGDTGARSFNSSVIADRIATGLVKTGRFDVLERTQIQKVLKEKNFPEIIKGGEYDYKKLGKLLSADAIITGNVFTGQRMVSLYRKKTLNSMVVPLAFIFPPVLMLPQSEELYTTVVSQLSVSVKVIDVDTAKILASEDLLESDLENIDLVNSRLYSQLIQYRPIEAKVVSLGGKEALAIIDAGNKAGVKVGDVFELAEPGKSFTQEGISEMVQLPEEKAGEAEIISVSKDASIAKIIPYLTFKEVKPGYIARMIPLETMSLTEIVRRKSKLNSRATGMGEAFIGQATGPDLAKYNPAGLAQIADTEISLGWRYRYNSAGTSLGNVKSFYGGYRESMFYPNEFNGLLQIQGATYGLHVSTDNLFINGTATPGFYLDDSTVNLGLFGGAPFASNFMTGTGLVLMDKQNIVIRNVGGTEYSYKFRGLGLGMKSGVLYSPNPQISIGGILALTTSYSGSLKVDDGTTKSFSIAGGSEGGLGLSYKPTDKLLLNLDVIDHFNYGWYDTRMGVEYSLSQNLALRVGNYNRLDRVPNFADDPNYPRNYDIKQAVYTAGVGYTEDKFYADLAIEASFLKESGVLVYPDITPGSTKRTTLDAFKELSVKFGIGAKF